MARAARSTALAPQVRPDLLLTEDEADLSSAAVDAFTIAIGGRTALLDTLVVADGTPEVHQIVRLLVDPRYGGWSLRRICALAGLTIADLFTAYRKALLVKAHLQATRLVTDNLVAVVDDVMKRSQPYEATCETCNGSASVTPEPTKLIPNPIAAPCLTCKGTGTLRCLPDLDRQKLALELGQLVQSRAGINIQQNSVSLTPGGAGGGGGAPGALEQLQQAVQAVLYPRASSTGESAEAPRAPIEAEIVDAPLGEASAP